MELITRQLCLTQHIGSKGILFGGQMLAWADAAASIWCMQLARVDHMTTVHMSDIDFVAPVRAGEIVEFFGESFRIGRTSVTVRIVVKIFQPSSGKTTEAFRFTAVMVNIDSSLRPAPLAEELQGKTGNADQASEIGR